MQIFGKNTGMDRVRMSRRGCAWNVYMREQEAAGTWGMQQEVRFEKAVITKGLVDLEGCYEM